MELAVLNTQGKETGRKVVLSDAVFGVEANDHAIYLDVKQYLADQRQGTHKSKQRNEVAGSTRKLKQLARRSALTYKAQAGAISVVETLSLDAPKTKAVVALADALKVADKKVLLVLPESNANLQLSCRNLPYVQPVLAQNVCTYDVMNASAIVMVEGAENVLNTMLA